MIWFVVRDLVGEGGDVRAGAERLESDDLLALLPVAQHGIPQLPQDGRLQLVVDNQRLLCGVHVQAPSLDLALEVARVTVHPAAGCSVGSLAGHHRRIVLSGMLVVAGAGSMVPC